jgi:glycosyltransferase involved in cell wall biosynthesis
MRILYCALDQTVPGTNGGSVHVAAVAEGLAARGHEVHVATYHLGDPVDLTGICTHRIAPLRSYTRMAPGPSLRKLLVVDRLLVIRLRRLLSEGPFDVIHAHHVEGLMIALLARPDRSVPVVFDAHTCLESELPYYAPGATRPLMGRIGRAFDRLLPSRADHTIAVTAELRARLLVAGSLDPADVSVVGNGIEFDVFEEAKRRARMRRRGKTLVFTGNLAPYQGIDLMLQAFALVRQRHPSARLSIVSQAPFAPYEDMAVALGIRDALDVSEVGFEAVPDHLAHADLALNPRLDMPGIAQKTLNYMVMGLPIVSFAGSGRHLAHGETALLVEDGDVAGFARAIGRLISDPQLARRLGDNASRLVRQKNDWTQSSKALEQVLHGVVGAARARVFERDSARLSRVE